MSEGSPSGQGGVTLGKGMNSGSRLAYPPAEIVLITRVHTNNYVRIYLE